MFSILFDHLARSEGSFYEYNIGYFFVAILVSCFCEGGGKCAYLKERRKLGPQAKQGRAMTATEEIGWRLGDTHNPLRPPRQKACKDRPSMICLL